MLPEKYQDLLSAFVDGELSAAQHKQALRLLRKSSRARKFVRQLQNDSRRLQSMTRLRMPADFPARVLQTISLQQGLEKVPAPAATTSVAPSAASSLPNWLGLALAASLLLAMTALSYLIFSGRLGNSQEQPILVEQKPEKPTVQPPLMQFTLTQWQEEETRQQLKDNTRRENALQLDLNCRDNAEAVSRLAQALKHNGIEVVVEAEADQDIKDRKKTSYILYVDNVQPYEVLTILDHLRQEQQEKPTPVDSVTVNLLAQNNRARVASLLGLSEDQLQPAEKLDPTQLPMPALDTGITTKPVQKAPASKGNSSPASQERLAVVLPAEIGPEANPARSSQIQRFVQARRSPRPGTLQLVFVLHEATA